MSEKDGQETGRRERRWLLAGAVLLALPLLAPVIPVLHPVALPLGGWMLFAGTTKVPTGALAPGTFHRFDVPLRPGTHRLTVGSGGPRYDVHGVLHAPMVRIGWWVYYFHWFPGSRGR